MYGILAIHEVLHTIRLRGYGKDAIPSYKKAPAEHLQELFYILIALYHLSGTSFTVFRAPP